MRRVGPVRPLRGQRFGINIAWFSTVSLQGCSERRLCSCVLGEFPIDLADETSREGLNNPILGGTRSVAVRRSGYEGLSER